MVIKHGEAYGTSKLLIIHKEAENNNPVIHRPTIHCAHLSTLIENLFIK
jgi:homospermidine synthase